MVFNKNISGQHKHSVDDVTDSGTAGEGERDAQPAHRRKHAHHECPSLERSFFKTIFLSQQ